MRVEGHTLSGYSKGRRMDLVRVQAGDNGVGGWTMLGCSEGRSVDLCQGTVGVEGWTFVRVRWG